MEAVKGWIIFILVIWLCSQIISYQQQISILGWSADTLWINVKANREMLRACKRFRWCDERHLPPRWERIWIGEFSFRI